MSIGMHSQSEILELSNSYSVVKLPGPKCDLFFWESRTAYNEIATALWGRWPSRSLTADHFA